MQNLIHVERLRQGADVWNQWRFDNLSETPQLAGAHIWRTDLSETNLSEADLSGAILSDADLSGANLRRADLGGAKLAGARLSDADLSGANLSNADLSDANLSGANLSGASLDGADIRRADLSGAKLAEITYDRRKLSGKCKGTQIATAYGHSLFKRDVQDQNYIDSMRDYVSESWWKRKFFRAWGWIDYGRSLGRVAIIAFSIVISFALTYKAFPDMLEIKHLPEWWGSPFYYSIVTYTTLGFGDITPKTEAGMILVTLEVILGYLTLGLLVSILANKVARRA